jgi:hypothetical protein
MLVMPVFDEFFVSYTGSFKSNRDGFYHKGPLSGIF